MKLNLNDSKGITVISLIITIIAMIIIAAISISAGLSSINSTQDGILESSLETVQQVISQKYAEARTLNNINKSINTTSSTDFIDSKPNSFIGIPLTTEEVKAKLEEHKQGDNELNLLNLNNANKTYDNIYYLLNDNDLDNLGITDAEGQEYIVNYETGEVWDISNVTYQSGEYAYINGFSTSIDVETEAFVDTPINISIFKSLEKSDEGYYSFSLKVTDDITKITPPDGTTREEDPDDFNINDITKAKLIIKIDGEEFILNEEPPNISITPTVIPDKNSPIGEHYIYEIKIIIPEDPSNPKDNHAVSMVINPEVIVDDEGNTNAITEITTTAEIKVDNNATLDLKLGAPQYQIKDKNGEPADGITVFGDDWGASASVEVILETTDKKGFNGQTFYIDYVWSTETNFSWDTEEIKQVSMTTKQGVSSAKSSIYLDGYTGKGTLHVRITNFTTASGNNFANTENSVEVNLDCTPPEINVYYKDENGEERDINEFLSKDNAFLRLYQKTETLSYAHITPQITYSYIDNETGLFSEETSEFWNSHIFFHEGQNPKEISEYFRHPSEIDPIKWYTTDHTYQNEVEFVIEDGIYKEYRILDMKYSPFLPSGEYYIALTTHPKFERYLSDNCGNELNDMYTIGPVQVDSISPQIKKIEIKDDGNAQIYIEDDYSGLSSDYSKIKYAWIKEDTITDDVVWKSVKEEQIKQEQTNTSTGNISEIVIDAGYPEDTEEYYLAVKLDGLEDIAGNGSSSTLISEETAILDVIEYTLENLKYISVNRAGETTDGFTIGGDAWGQSATIDVKLTSTGKNGLKSQYYEFEYVWNDKEDYNWDTNLTDIRVANVSAISGDKVASTTLTINSYTGKGYLHVRPRAEHETSAGVKLDITSKSVAINLDNTKPKLKIEYQNPDGTYEDMENAIKNDKFFKRGDLIDSSTGVSKDNYLLSPTIQVGFRDEDSGIVTAPDGTTSINWGFHTRADYELYSEQNLIFNLGINSTQSIEVKDDNGYPREYTNQMHYRGNYESGEYYIIVFDRSADSIISNLSDNCGNKFADYKAIGPIKLDEYAPKITEISIDEDGKGQINIIDDYSGLSGDYTKIKYGWVKDATANPSKWESVNENQVSVNLSTDLGVPKDITINVDYPATETDWILCVKLDDYEDYAGNVANMCTSELATDLKITLKENDEIAYPTNVAYTIKSESGKEFEIKDIWYEHVGLNDIAGRIQFDTYYRFDNTKGTINPITNGPIKLHVVDSIGREYVSDEFIVKNVQETILTFNAQAGKCLMLPIINKTPANIDMMLYVDWGDGIGNYVTESSYYITHISSSGKHVQFFDENSKTGYHVYANTEQVSIKISGNLTTFWNLSDAWSFVWQIEKGYISTDDSCERYIDMLNYIAKGIVGIEQFGIHTNINAGDSTFDMDNFFMSCTNLDTICEYNKVNENAFAKVTSMEYTFYETSISSFDKRFLNSASKIMSMKSTFSSCKNLKHIDVDIFDNCPSMNNFEDTFADSGLEEIPTNSAGESIFKNNLNVATFEGTFSNTSIESIPVKLFEGNSHKLLTLTSCFSHTNISDIPDDLFDNLSVTSFRSTFRDCTNLKNISSKMFGNNINKSALTGISEMFGGCTSLTNIEDAIFADFTRIGSARYVFRDCTKLSKVKYEIFRNCNSLKDVAGMFYNCSSLTYVHPNLFDYSKNTINKLTLAGLIIGTTDSSNIIPYYGIFENCTVLETCPKLWEWSQFSSTNLSKDTYDAYNGVQNTTIRQAITFKNLDEWWLQNHEDIN